MPEKKKSLFEQLDSINVNEYTEKKGQFTYLSWAWAVRELLKVAPDATWIVHKFGELENQQPYMKTDAGCFVQVTVHVGDIGRTQVHPVLDNRNKTIDEPNAFDINTSIQRCLAKAIALHGLGLYIYAGEDLPEIEPLSTEQIQNLLEVAHTISNDKEERIAELVDNGEINQGNYKACMARLEREANDNKQSKSSK